MGTDTKIIIGYYPMITQTNTKISVKSTNNSIDGEQHSFSPSLPGIGAIIGFKNNYNRFYLSYDFSYHEELDQERLMFNLDFYDTKAYGWQPMIGIALGQATNAYEIHNRYLEQTNGVASIKAGASWKITDIDSFEFIFEYSKILTNNTGTSVNDGDFTTYNIQSKDDLMFRFGYTIEF